MKRLVMLVGCLTAVMVLTTGCPKKKPVQPPIPPPVTEPTEPTEPVTPEPVKLEPSKPAYSLTTIHFDFDKYNIRPGDAVILENNANYLKQNPSIVLTLEGHCDPIGTEEYNRGLGLRRANAAKNYLVQLGIDANRLATISYGEERLVTTDEDQFELNRRVEFVVR